MIGGRRDRRRRHGGHGGGGRSLPRPTPVSADLMGAMKQPAAVSGSQEGACGYRQPRGPPSTRACQGVGLLGGELWTPRHQIGQELLARRPLRLGGDRHQHKEGRCAGHGTHVVGFRGGAVGQSKTGRVGGGGRPCQEGTGPSSSELMLSQGCA